VCPIGQFQFVGSLVSPLEVRVRDPRSARRAGRTIAFAAGATRRGCELDLFLPRKAAASIARSASTASTRAPHDNVGLLVASPGDAIVFDGRRSSIGRLSQRIDVRGARAPAGAGGVRDGGRDGGAGVVPPVLLVLLAAPPLAVAGLAAAPPAVRERTCRFVLALVPLGFTMWTAHFLFHLVRGWSGMVLASERALADLGMATAPRWSAGPGALGPGRLLGLELLLLDAGLLLTLWVGWRIARDAAPRLRRALTLVAPCAGVAAALWAAGVWIVCQPMAMRGMMMH
jgi:hypothetical protein